MTSRWRTSLRRKCWAAPWTSCRRRPAACWVASASLSRGKDARRNATFSRRELRNACGWSLTQVRVHLERLVDLECLAIRHGRLGSQFVYELLLDLDAPEAVAHVGLIDVKVLAHGYKTNLAGFGGGGGGAKRPPGGGWRNRPATPCAVASQHFGANLAG